MGMSPGFNRFSGSLVSALMLLLGFMKDNEKNSCSSWLLTTVGPWTTQVLKFQGTLIHGYISVDMQSALCLPRFFIHRFSQLWIKNYFWSLFGNPQMQKTNLMYCYVRDLSIHRFFCPWVSETRTWWIDSKGLFWGSQELYADFLLCFTKNPLLIFSSRSSPQSPTRWESLNLFHFRKPRAGEAMQFAQDHIASKQRS